jgi:hypothetical protein
MLTSFAFDFHLLNDIKSDSQYYPPLTRNVLPIYILALGDVAVILHLPEAEVENGRKCGRTNNYRNQTCVNDAVAKPSVHY